jgi:O-acetyl-ADP-ribose deacetylase (regulator of RNase III)
MLRYVNSALFSSPARVLVNTVNTVGVMGKGVALEFKKRYPDMYERYRDLCLAGQIDVGTLWLWRSSERWVLNFPTKKHWRDPSRPEYIEAGLRKFVSSYQGQGVTSASFPLLGCGNGQLDFDSQVRPLMERYLRVVTIPVYVHLRLEPSSFVAEQDEPDLFAPFAIPPRSFRDFWRDIRQLAERYPEVRLKTLSAETPFRLAYATDDNVVFVRGASDRTVHIPQSDFYDLWITLSITGSITPTEAPGRIGREYGLVFAFLALLPYLDPVQISSSYETLLDRPPYGLQLRFAAGPRSEPVEAQLA